jgi:D-lactate dehydrogenase
MAPGLPLWPVRLSGAPKLPKRVAMPGERQIVYIPSCVTRMLRVEGAESTVDALLSVATKVGIDVILPENIHGACCGQLFSSKGFATAYQYTADKMLALLWELSQEGRFPVVMDVSSCTYTMLNDRKRFDGLQILDVVDFLHDMVLPLATDIRRTENVVLHPVCSLHKMNTYGKFVAVARHFAAGVTVPLHAGCCGMAGDRGFFFPELTAVATADEAQEVGAMSFDGYYSSAASCELAMSEATGKAYESILRLADKALSARAGIERRLR